MKTFSFRVTQDLKAFYEGEISIKAKSEKEARKILDGMTTDELSEITTDWVQNTDNAEPEGEITIEELNDVE